MESRMGRATAEDGHQTFSNLQTGDLKLDLTSLVGYNLQLCIATWSSGIRWSTISESDPYEFHYFQKPGIPLNKLVDIAEASEWISNFPDGLVEKCLDFEEQYEGSLFTALWFASRYPHFHELFLSGPFYAWLILSMAERKHWTEKQIVTLARQKRREILKACGFNGNKSEQKLLCRYQTRRMTLEQIQKLAHLSQMDGIQSLNHLGNFDRNLLNFALQYPEFLQSRLIHSYRITSWSWEQFRHDLDGIVRMSGAMGVPDPITSIFNCVTRNAVNNLHDRLVDQFTESEADRITDTAFPEPPYQGNETILPVTSNRELFKEGKKQRHCVFSYRDSINKGTYYVYQIMEPERATLGIKRKNGIWEIDQVKLHRNQRPTDETLEAINNWLNKEKMIQDSH
jgi:hypothetical protein